MLCSPWLLVEPEALTAELNVASVPVGKSSIEPDKSLMVDASLKEHGKLDGLSCCIIFKSSWLVFPGAIEGGCVLFP